MNDLTGLREFSARLGGDVMLVQGAGGNTSIKDGDTLTVKASGKRLADALEQDIFVTLPLQAARAMNGDLPATGPLRPSIETLMHAILPHRVVAHVHSIDVLAEAVRTDAGSRLGQKLAGLRWAFIPYVRPGVPLALAVQAAAADADIFILGNHGLLVGGDDFATCEAIIADVRRRLKSSARVGVASPADLENVARATGLVPATHAEAHWAALDPASLSVALCGTLYPDHVVFLGRGATELISNAAPAFDGPSGLFLAPGVGAFLRPDALPAAHEMAGCLGMVAAHVAAGAPISPLSFEQENELLNWDAEKHRQRLAAAAT